MARRRSSHSVRRRRRPGFILLFGSRNIISNESVPPVETNCPRCNQLTTIVGKTYRNWFTLFFLPVFPLSGSARFSECTACHAQFPVPVDDLRRGLAVNEQQQNQQAIALYNSLRASPANSITLNQLMLMYAGMNDYAQAISAANDFPDALRASEQCMSTLGRVYLANEQRKEAQQWLDQALARNPSLGEAHYYKAVAHLTDDPPDYAAAVAAARQARNAGYQNADALLREAESKARAD
jgi:tetratricopeptide (TPR) repeat protein